METLLAAALLPPIALIVLIWKIDKLEKEPIKLIAVVTIFGALSGIAAYILEIVASYPISMFFGNDYSTYLIADNFLGVALVEEGVKMFVLMFFIWRKTEFDCLFDGVVYGACASLGFAALENVLYTFQYGLSTAITRAFTAIPGHMIFGIAMGSLIAYAKLYKVQGDSLLKNSMLFCAIVIPTIAHGFYDYLLSDPFASAYTLWFAYFGAILIVAIIVIIRMAKADRRILDKPTQTIL